MYHSLSLPYVRRVAHVKSSFLVGVIPQMTAMLRVEPWVHAVSLHKWHGRLRHIRKLLKDTSKVQIFPLIY